MNNFLKALTITIIVSLGLALFSYSQNQEHITITTYYPSPRGSFNQLGINKLAVNVTGVATQNEYTAMRPGDVHIGRSLIVGPSANSIGGNSGYSYTQLNRTADNRPANGGVLISGPIGIGTTRPLAGLHIRGNESTNTSAIFVENTDSARRYSFRINSNGHLSIRDELNNTNRFVVTPGNAPGFLEVNGHYGGVSMGSNITGQIFEVKGGMKFGSESVCNANRAGTIRYNNMRIEYCNGDTWVNYAVPYSWVQIPGNATLNSTSSGSFLEWRSGEDASPNKICQNAGFTTFTGACWTPEYPEDPHDRAHYACQGTVNTNNWRGWWRLGCNRGGRERTNINTTIMCVK